MSFNDHLGAGLTAITFERAHQVDLGYDVEHDAARYSVEELMRVGTCYVDYGTNMLEGSDQDTPHPFWPAHTGIPWTLEKESTDYIVKGAAYLAAALDLKHAQDLER